MEHDKSVRTLELVDVATATQRDITPPHVDAIEAPRWSPDGAELAFVRSGTGKDAQPQVWVMPVGAAAGEARAGNHRKEWRRSLRMASRTVKQSRT